MYLPQRVGRLPDSPGHLLGAHIGAQPNQGARSAPRVASGRHRSTMQRFRNTWVALVGGALLLVLSVSAAFGADPADSDGNRGQSVAAFVHDLVFGADEGTDDQTEEEDGDTDEEADEDSDEDSADETDEDSADDADEDSEEDSDADEDADTDE